MKYHDYDETDVSQAIAFSQDNCDAARSLRVVLDALVDCNFQEADEFDDEENEERKSSAKLFLFQLATRLTNGYRNKQE